MKRQETNDDQNSRNTQKGRKYAHSASKISRFFAVLLCAVMILTVVPTNVIAANSDNATTAATVSAQGTAETGNTENEVQSKAKTNAETAAPSVTPTATAENSGSEAAGSQPSTNVTEDSAGVSKENNATDSSTNGTAASSSESGNAESDISEKNESAEDISEEKAEIESISVASNTANESLLGAAEWDENSRLNDLVTSADIKKVSDASVEKDKDGNYIIYPNSVYKVTLDFQETTNKQFTNDENTPMVYDLPKGVTANDVDEKAVVVPITFAGVTYNGTCYYLIREGKIIITKWDDTNFSKVTSASNVNIGITFNATFDGNKNVIDWGNGHKTNYITSDQASLTATKEGSYNPSSGKINYTVTLRSAGSSENVEISDQLGENLTFSGEPVTYQTSSGRTDLPEITPQKGTNSFVAGNTFNMSDGEEIKISYSVIPDLSKLSFADNKYTMTANNGFSAQGTNTNKIDTNKTITIDQWPGITKTAKDIQNGQTLTPDKDGYVTIPWEITYNTGAKLPVNGVTLNDELTTSLTPETKVPVTIQRYDAGGNPVNDPITITSENGKTWSYKIEDSEKYEYRITYTTRMKADDLINVQDVSNRISDSLNQSGTFGVKVSPGEDGIAGLNKVAYAVADDQITWAITLTVPENGLNKAVVTDTYPSNNNYQDTFHGIQRVEGLDPQESYKVDSATDSKCATITFYKKVDGVEKPGLIGNGQSTRTIVIYLVTNVDQEWLNFAQDPQNSWAKTHTNKVDLNGEIQTSADATPQKFTLQKSVPNPNGITTSDIYSSDGQFTGRNINFNYDVHLTGAPAQEFDITDTFPQYLDFGSGSVYGGDQYYQGESCGTLTQTGSANNEDGTKTVILHVALNGLPTKYTDYRLSYNLVATADNSEFYNQLKANNGTLTFDNTAKYDDDHKSTAKQTYKYSDKVQKTGTQEGTTPYVDYTVTINPNAATMNGGKPMTVTDTFSNLSIVYSSVQAEVAGTGNATADDVKWSFKGNTGTFTIPDSTRVIITYRARVISSGLVSSNTAAFDGQTAGCDQNISFNQDAQAGGSNLSITLIKCDSENEAVKLPGAVYTLYASNKKLKDFTTDEDGKATIFGDQKNDGFTLEKGKDYYLKETKAPEGYSLDSNTEYHFIIGDKPDYANHIYYDGDELRVKDTKLSTTTDITITKNWDDNSNQDGIRPSAEDFKSWISVYDGDTEIKDASETVTDNGDGTYTVSYSGLPAKKNGKTIKYTVKETLPENCGYKTEAASTDNGGTITNTHTPDTTSISITKKWEDGSNQDGIRPSAEEFRNWVSLYRNDKAATDAVAEVTDNKDNTYTVTYSNLPRYANGKEITYKVTETIPGGSTYTADKSEAEDKGTITNSSTPGTTSISITKKWDDNSNQDGIRPSAEEFKNWISVYDGDTEIKDASETVTDNGDGTYTVSYSGLPAKKNGKTIKYTVKETLPENCGYKTEAASTDNGGTITNTHTPDTTSIRITKKWEDNSNKDGIRPSADDFAKWVSLYRDDEVVTDAAAEVTDNKDNTYTVTYSNLPKYENGKLISYSIVESLSDKTGYISEQTKAVNGESITNSELNVRVEKTDITNGRVVSGATIEVIDKETNKKVTWSDGQKENNIGGKLEAGHTYILHETEAPKGYAVAADTTFTLDKNGKIDVSKTTAKVKDGILLVEDMPYGTASITKRDTDAKNGKTLKNCHYKLFRQVGSSDKSTLTSTVIVDSTEKAVTTYPLSSASGTVKQYYAGIDKTSGMAVWTTDVNAAGVVDFVSGDDGVTTPMATGLTKGTYYFVETEAPDGYMIDTEPTEVVIGAANVGSNAANVAAVSQADVRTAVVSLSVKKALKGDGAPTTIPNIFNFKIEAVTTGAPLPEQTTVTNNGSVATFGDIAFNFDTATVDELTYVYRITESGMTDTNYSYSLSKDAIYAKVTLTVSRTEQNGGYARNVNTSVKYYSDEACTKELSDAVITNTYTKTTNSVTTSTAGNVKTGDTTQIMLYLLLLAAGAVSLAVLEDKRRRKNENR